MVKKKKSSNSDISEKSSKKRSSNTDVKAKKSKKQKSSSDESVKNKDNNYTINPDNMEQQYNLQTKKAACGTEFQPIMQNQDNVNFNPQIAKQIGIDEWKNDKGGDNDSNSSGSRIDEVEEKKKKNKYKVRSKMKSFASELILLVISDIITIGVIGAVFYVITGPKIQQITFLFYFLSAVQIIFKACYISCNTQTGSLLNNILLDKGAREYVDKLRGKRPKPRYGIECQHYETQQEDGKRKERKVITFTKFKQFNQHQWADWSPEIQKALDKHRLTAIVVRKKLIFFDEKTQKHYNKLFSKFVNKYKDRDSRFNTFTNCHINEYKQQTLAMRKANDLPCQFNTCQWYIACLLVTSPLQYLFWSQVATIDQTLMKVVSNKRKIVIHDDEGGEGDLDSCTASDSTCSNLGLKEDNI